MVPETVDSTRELRGVSRHLMVPALGIPLMPWRSGQSPSLRLVLGETDRASENAPFGSQELMSYIMGRGSAIRRCHTSARDQRGTNGAMVLRFEYSAAEARQRHS